MPLDAPDGALGVGVSLLSLHISELSFATIMGEEQSTADLARVMQDFDGQEARREQAAADRDARREMQNAATQLAALRGSPPAGGHHCGGFIPNKGLSEIKSLSGSGGPTFRSPPCR
jgi:hypothetical protein